MIPAHLGGVGIDPSRHPDQPENVHRKERDVKANERQPEVPAADSFAEHSTGDLGKPVIDGANEGKHGAADQHVMKMSHHEISVMDLRIYRHRSHHHAREAAKYEDRNEPENE